MRLTTNNITKSFGDKQVLKGITLQAESGKALGLLGRNGAGKTTTLRIIMDVFKADTGGVLLDGKEFHRDRIRIGYLPEERGLYPKKQILEQLVYFAILRGMKRSDAIKSGKRLLERLEMSDTASKKLDTLSKGNQQKIQLAAALIHDPNIVILDEPFSGLDPVNAKMLKDMVNELLVDGKIVLFSSHQMNYIEEFCNDISILNSGNIVLEGNLKQIKRNYDRRRLVIRGRNVQPIYSYAKNEMKGIVNSAEMADDIVSLTIVDENKKNTVISQLMLKNFDIDEIKVFEPTLNDIFVQYAGGAI